MYQSIFDYREEFRRCNRILRKHGCKSVLELGCGSGTLARHFLDAGYDYTGMDIAPEMLAIAKSEVPGARFIRGDMRRFSLTKKFDAVLICGRSFAYMTTNQDVRGALRSIHRVLKAEGILMFDNFNAVTLFKEFSNRITQKVKAGGKTFIRRSDNSLNLKTGWTWNWDARYVIKEGGKTRTFRDRSVLRAFTQDEMDLFLTLARFAPLSIRKQAVAMFIVAQARRGN